MDSRFPPCTEIREPQERGLTVAALHAEGLERQGHSRLAT